MKASIMALLLETSKLRIIQLTSKNSMVADDDQSGCSR